MRTAIVASLAMLVGVTGCSSDPTDQPSDAAPPDAGSEDAAVPDAGGPNPCASDVIAIATQADIDAIASCTTLSGTIDVQSTNLVEVRLPQLTQIGGAVLIQANEQLSLVDMSGLQNASTIAIVANPALTTANFSQLASAGTDLEVGETALTDLSGFGCLCADTVVVQGNPALLTMSGVALAGHNVLILDNMALTDLGTVTADVRLAITGNGALSVIPDGPSSSLTALTVKGNATLSAIAGLTSLTQVDELEIASNPMLVDIAHFDALTDVPTSFDVTNNAQLPNCQAEALRDQLTTVGAVAISGNDELATCP